MYVSCCDYLLAVKIYNKQLPKITSSQTSQPTPIAFINFSWPAIIKYPFYSPVK